MTEKRDRPEGFHALPQRFKTYVAKLENDLRDVRAALPSQVPSRVSIGYDSDAYLPDTTVMQYAVGGSILQVRLEDRGDWQVLEVRQTGSMSGAVAVWPSSGNVVYLSPTEFNGRLMQRRKDGR